MCVRRGVKDNRCRSQFPVRSPDVATLKTHTSQRSRCRWISCRWIPAQRTLSKKTSLCSASSTRLSTRHCPHLLLSPVARRRCCWAPAPAIDRYLLSACRPATNWTNSPNATTVVDRRDRQTDRWIEGLTPDRYINFAPHTTRAVPIIYLGL